MTSSIDDASMTPCGGAASAAGRPSTSRKPFWLEGHRALRDGRGARGARALRRRRRHPGCLEAVPQGRLARLREQAGQGQ
eukprot:6922280-Pyramimonas_sp.AAC.1